jgi:NAD(P)-dependent dehydrogenase (short-subunit alcohol dehydrogenase family)
MVQRRGGVLIFVSSRSGIDGFANEAAYCAAKHGLEGLSKSLALEGHDDGIISATITPGMFMRTPTSEITYSPEERLRWVEPDVLAPAFSLIAEQRSQDFSGRRLNAWQLVRGESAQ